MAKPKARAQELLRDLREGAAIVDSEGNRVLYRPARKGDRKPWLHVDNTGTEHRYRTSECRAVTPNGGGPWSVARLVRIS